MITPKITRVPKFIKAKTPDKLRELMLATNIKYGAELKYTDIGYQDGNWYAWFIADEIGVPQPQSTTVG